MKSFFQQFLGQRNPCISIWISRSKFTYLSETHAENFKPAAWIYLVTQQIPHNNINTTNWIIKYQLHSCQRYSKPWVRIIRYNILNLNENGFCSVSYFEFIIPIGNRNSESGSILYPNFYDSIPTPNSIPKEKLNSSDIYFFDPCKLIVSLRYAFNWLPLDFSFIYLVYFPQNHFTQTESVKPFCTLIQPIFNQIKILPQKIRLKKRISHLLTLFG